MIVCTQDDEEYSKYKDVVKFFSKEQVHFKSSLNKWHSMILLSFNKDPLSCPICNNTMVYSSVFT